MAPDPWRNTVSSLISRVKTRIKAEKKTERNGKEKRGNKKRQGKLKLKKDEIQANGAKVRAKKVGEE
jgi:hypothetical protein